MKHPCTPPRGFTLVEMLVGAALSVVLVLGIFSALDSGGRFVERGVRIAEVESHARRLLERMTRELESSGVGTFVPGGSLVTGSSDLTFQRNQGYVAGAIVWGAQARIASVLDPAETDNGLDDDGDGLVDEGRLTYWPDVAGGPVAWANGVAEFLEGEVGGNGLDDNGNGLTDEPGLCFTLVGRVLTLRITIERAGVGGVRARDSSETSLLVRNP